MCKLNSLHFEFLAVRLLTLYLLYSIILAMCIIFVRSLYVSLHANMLVISHS